jgi:hypothetical protein
MDIKNDTQPELIPVTPKRVSLADDTDWKSQQEIPEEPTNLALKELGMESLTLKKIRGYKKIANVLKSVGMVEYERGRLMHREHSLEATIIAMTELVLHDGNKDTKIAAAMALKELVGAANKTAELNIRLEELAQVKAQEQKTDTGLPPMAQQVNFIVHNPPADVKKQASPTIIDTVT